MHGAHWREEAIVTHIQVEQELVDRVWAISGADTKTAAVTLALQEFISRRQQSRLLDLLGTLDWDPTYDYKAERWR